MRAARDAEEGQLSLIANTKDLNAVPREAVDGSNQLVGVGSSAQWVRANDRDTRCAGGLGESDRVSRASTTACIASGEIRPPDSTTSPSPIRSLTSTRGVSCATVPGRMTRLVRAARTWTLLLPMSMAAATRGEDLVGTCAVSLLSLAVAARPNWLTFWSDSALLSQPYRADRVPWFSSR